MNTATATNSTSRTLIFARQIVGMAILALANPLVWYSNEPVLRWLESWGVPVLIALVAFGLYALVFTKRAKQAWPGRFFLLAWVLVALVTAGPWISLSRGPAQPVSTQAPTGNHNSASRTMEGATSQRAAGIDWEKGSMTPPTTPQVNPGSAEKSFTYEEAYGLPPAQK